MELEQQLREALQPRSPGPEVRAAVMARVSAATSSRRGRWMTRGPGFIAGGVLCVAAAAAAALLPEMPWASRRTVEAGTAAPVHTPLSPSDAGLALPQALPLPVIAQPGTVLSPGAHADGVLQDGLQQGWSPSPLVVVQVLGALESAEAGNADQDAAAAFRARQHATLQDPARRVALESFHAELVALLRTVPGLVLFDPGAAPGVPQASPPTHRIRIDATLETIDGGPAVEDRMLDFLVLAEAAKAPHPAERALAFAGIDLDARCPRPGRASRPCLDAHAAAAQVVFLLQARNFPPGMRAAQLPLTLPDDPGAMADHMATLRTEEPEIRAAITALKRHPSIVAASLQSAAADPAARAGIWRRLRGSGHADLIDPLLESVRHDSGEARLQAVATLAADFPAVPRVRTALATLAQEDPQPLLRALANRGLSGEDTWMAYIASSLADTTRPPEQRIEAFVYHYASGRYAAGLDDISPESVRTLALLLPEAAPRMPQEKVWLDGLRMSLGFRLRKDQSVMDGLLRMLEPAVPLHTRRVAARMLGSAGGSEPWVRDAVVLALSQDPDPFLQEFVRAGREAARTRP